MTNDIKRGPLGNTLVLHDFRRDFLDLKGWFEYVEQWMLRHGLSPTKMSGKGSKTITFSRGKKQQEKENFESLRQGVWIAALPPDEKVGTEMFDFIFAVDLDKNPNEKMTMSLCWDDKIVKFDRIYLEELAKDLYIFFEPAYGYGYQREFRYGPSFYPFGFIGNKALSDDEEDQIAKWDTEYAYREGNYKTGMFRDIYPINFLSPKHFTIDIQGQDLKTWIEAHADRGELKQLAPDFWSWWVEEKNIEDVRKALIPTGMLVAYL